MSDSADATLGRPSFGPNADGGLWSDFVCVSAQDEPTGARCCRMSRRQRRFDAFMLGLGVFLAVVGALLGHVGF